MENAVSKKTNASRIFDADEVKALSRVVGADIVGIASAETLNAYPPDPRWPQTPKRISPDAKSIIILGMRVPVASFRTREPEPYQMMNMMILRRLDVVARRVSEALERRGFSGLVMNSNGSDWELKSGTYGPLSLRHLAVEAGLGTLGLGVNFMCVEYGPRVNLSVVTTDAELEPGKPMAEQLCLGEGCSRCLYACPTDAVLHYNIEKRQCAIEAQTTGFYGAADLFQKFVEADDVGKKDVLNSSRLLHYWQGLTRVWGCFGTCPRCTAVCPVGDDYHEFLAEPQKVIPETTPDRIEKGKTYKQARKRGKDIPGLNDWNIRWVGPKDYSGKAAKAQRNKFRAEHKNRLSEISE
jgi:epoxyqueuosine reductase QueG